MKTNASDKLNRTKRLAKVNSKKGVRDNHHIKPTNPVSRKTKVYEQYIFY